MRALPLEPHAIPGHGPGLEARWKRGEGRGRGWGAKRRGGLPPESWNRAAARRAPIAALVLNDTAKPLKTKGGAVQSREQRL
jgi:hypothetical protein